jgi:hypothetical protein
MGERIFLNGIRKTCVNMSSGAETCLPGNCMELPSLKAKIIEVKREMSIAMVD